MSSADAEPAVQRLADTDVCLFIGGPLYQLLRRAHLADDALGHVRRRIVAIILILWAPLLVLSALQGGFLGGGKSVDFLDDFECHVRFLVVVPLLVYAELFVHLRLRRAIGQFETRGLVKPPDRPRFDAVISRILLLRNSVSAEVILVTFVYAVGILVVWRHDTALQLNSWYSIRSGGAEKLSLAGYWYVLISLPIYQFLLLRWYFRLFIWARLLWAISRFELDLYVMHPDGTGGLGFLAASPRAFLPLALAHGALLASWIANRIFYAGAKLTDFFTDMFFLVIFLLLIFVGPLLVFLPKLETLQRTSLGRYGGLGQVYARDFDAKWLSGGAPEGEQILGTSDIQSLADLRSAYAVAEEMRIMPFSRRAMVEIIIAALAPISPLVLTIIPAEKIIGQLFGMVF
jgi:hypothetical protein